MPEEAQNNKLEVRGSEARKALRKRGTDSEERNSDTASGEQLSVNVMPEGAVPEEARSEEAVPEEAVPEEAPSGTATPIEEKARRVEDESGPSEQAPSDTQVRESPSASESPEKPTASDTQVQESPSARPSNNTQRRPYSSGRGRNDTQRPGQNGSGSRQRRGYFRRKVCRLCVNKIKTVDYKDVDLLKRFVTDRGKILPRRMTGTCAKHQRVLAAAIKRARTAAFLPFVKK